MATSLAQRGYVALLKRELQTAEKRCRQALAILESCSEPEFVAVAVLHVRRMHDHGNRQANRVGENVALAAFDHLFSRITARATRLGRFDRPAVDHAGDI